MNKKRLLRTLIILAICIAVTVSYIVSKDIKQKSTSEKLKVIADGFTIPGLLVTGFGFMMVISDTGSLDGVVYGMQQAIRMLTFQLLSKEKQQSYGDFKEQRDEIRRLRKERSGGFWYIVFIGLTFLLMAFVFVILYLQNT